MGASPLMPESDIENNEIVTLKFGGGLFTSASEEEIDERECVDGSYNLKLTADNRELKPRPPFDLLDTTPDGEEIRGMICLEKTDGSSQIAVQTAGGNVYEYTASGFTVTPIATGVNAAARLRGRIEHNWNLSDEVLVTDLELQENIIKWDGSTWSDVSFSGVTGDLRAKYCQVDRERALFANLYDNGTNFPHLMIGSAVEDYTTVTSSTVPTGLDDEFFIPMPNLRPINGMVAAFESVVFSTPLHAYILNGSDATDFSIDALHRNSGGSGDECLAYVGNDLVIGQKGRIESLRATDRYANVAADDLSRWISDQVKTYKDWSLVWNDRTRELHCFADGVSADWVFYKDVFDAGGSNIISPWMKHKTSNAMAYQPTCVMNMLDPVDGLEYIFMGDSSGNFYRLEGTGLNGDAGSSDIKSVHLSKVWQAPDQTMNHNWIGYLTYRIDTSFTIDLTFKYSGQVIDDQTIQLITQGTSANGYYSGGQYYSDNQFYGRINVGRLARETFDAPGNGELIQLQTEITQNSPWKVNEIGLRFDQTIP